MSHAPLFALLALDVEVMRRLLAALVDEIGREVEVLPLAGQMIELDQRQLDLLVPVIAVLLARVRYRRRWRIWSR